MFQCFTISTSVSLGQQLKSICSMPIAFSLSCKLSFFEFFDIKDWPGRTTLHLCSQDLDQHKCRNLETSSTTSFAVKN